jgi:hypothetical protein
MASRSLGRALRVALPALACACGALAAVTLGPSCTIWNGVTFSPELDAGPSVDAGPDASYEHYLTVADAAKVCSLLATCPEPELAQSITESTGVPVDFGNFANCMEWVAGPIPSNRIGLTIQRSVLSCVAMATSCVAAGKCLSEELFAAGDPRCAGLDAGDDAGDAASDAAPSLDTCLDNGATVQRCSGGNALHCGSAYFEGGAKCLTGADGTSWCATGTMCTQATTCAGSNLEYCGSGTQLRFGINCAAVGNTCGIDPKTKQADCLTDGTVQLCPDTSSDCDKDRVKVCDFDRYSIFDCAKLGGTCSKDLGSALCVRPGDTCTPFDPDVNVCTGTSISLCLAGAKTSFDCASIKKTCVAGACK